MGLLKGAMRKIDLIHIAKPTFTKNSYHNEEAVATMNALTVLSRHLQKIWLNFNL